MADRSLRFDLVGRDKSFSKTLDAAGRKGQRVNRDLTRTFGDAGDKAGRRFSLGLNRRMGGGFSAFTRMAVRSIGAIGAAFAAVAAVNWLKGAIDEAREAQKVGRQTAAVIKSTGGAAKVTAKQVEGMAESISNAVGVDDELIQSGENWLLTFKRVRDEAGKGNQIFSRATQAAVDLAASMHQGEVSASGLHSANTMLGKALNDPIKGMTSLAKAGVTFTKQQQTQIKTLVESGDVLGAQKVILGEVESQVAGFAKASADPWDKMAVAINNVKEDIGKALLPAIDSAATFVTTKLIPAVKNFVDKHGAAFGRVFDTIRDAIGGMIGKARAWWETHGPAVIQAFDDAKTAVFGVRGELDKTKQAWDDNSTAIQGLVSSIAGLTGDAGLPSIATIMKRIGEEVRTVIKLWGLFSRAVIIASALVNDAVNFTFATIIEAWQTIVRAAATTAEALHLPFAKALRKNEQDVGRMADTFQSKLGATQKAIDKLHGKDIDITATTSLQFTKSFSQADWLNARRAAGRMAKGGIITTGTGPTADDVPALLSRGETVVPAHATRDPSFQQWASAKGIPGFASGGLVGGVTGTGQAHTGVGKIMDRWGTLIEAAGVRALMAGGPGIQRALAWARGQVGKPYGWGMVGPGSYDCSGFMSAITNVVMGRNPYHRLFATGSFPVGGWAPGYTPAGFSIGSRRGNPGHMAGTLAGVNVESRGSRGVVVGGGARGARDGLFGGNIWHLAGRSAAKSNSAETFTFFDQGGMLQPGATLALNNTGRPEAVGFDYDKMAAAFVRALEERPPAVYLDRQKVSRAVRNGTLWEARR